MHWQAPNGDDGPPRRSFATRLTRLGIMVLFAIPPMFVVALGFGFASR
jgi:hypothetical protein